MIQMAVEFAPVHVNVPSEDVSLPFEINHWVANVPVAILTAVLFAQPVSASAVKVAPDAPACSIHAPIVALPELAYVPIERLQVAGLA